MAVPTLDGTPLATEAELQTPPSLKTLPSDMSSKTSPGGKLILDSDVATFSFRHGSDAIENDHVRALDKLSVVMLSNSSARITLTGYAGTSGDFTPRDAKKLSLARAQALRDYLANKGVTSSRIDIRALGANVPSGDMDRVDVKVN